MERKQGIIDFILTRPRLSVLTGVLLIFLGILFSGLPTMIASLRWSTAEGIITSHQFQGKTFREYDGDAYKEVHVFIRYEYTVDAVTYMSQSINAFDLPFYPPEVAARYPVDKKVTVYYDPKNPAEAVLEPGFVDVLKAFDVFSYLFFGAGIYFIHHGISGRKKAAIRFHHQYK